MKHKIKTFSQLIISFIILIGIALILIYFAKPKAATTQELQVYFLDVGQGDAEYIKTPDGSDILIDGGPDNSVLDQLGKVMSFSDREINLVILSHPHADHLTGLIEVLQRYKVNEVWQTGVEYPSATYNTFKNEIQNQNILNKYVVAGEIKNFSDVKIEVITPLSSLEKKSIDNVNNASIVNRLEYNKFSVLFLGDAETEIQKKIAKDMKVATVLKTGHHGSKNGTIEEMLAIIRPAIAVISAGKNNKYGHPHAEALNLLKQYAVRIFRTDQNGTVEIDSDGNGYSVKTGSL